MTPKKSNPAQRAAGRVRECHKQAAFDTPDNTTAPDSLQALRSSWLQRRVPLSPHMAAAVMAVYFEGVAR
jgi:hypothetical protein